MEYGHRVAPFINIKHHGFLDLNKRTSCEKKKSLLHLLRKGKEIKSCWQDAFSIGVGRICWRSKSFFLGKLLKGRLITYGSMVITTP